MTWALRTSSGRIDVERVRVALGAVDAQLPFIAFESMDGVIARDLELPRFMATLLSIFAGLALVLASIGLYGLLAYVATQRTREVGIRLALGSTGGGVFRDFLREGCSLAGGGIAIGLVGAALVTRSLTLFLYGVTPLDPTTFLLVAGLLVAIAV